MIDKISGKVAYAVLSFGGFMGIGDDYYPVPWSMLKYDTNLGGYRVSLTKDQPFKRPDGYTADIRYDPERRNWSNQRVGSALRFNNEDYKIVAINPNEVVLSAKSNDKHWTIKSNAPP